MKAFQLEFDLPPPWQGKRFHVDHIGAINFLVGPNGSGKSRFAETLKQQPRLNNRHRLLGTDRLGGMERNPGLGFLGDSFSQGLQKSWFSQFKNAGTNFGYGIDTLVLLEERLDLRVRVEATLSNLFNRRISLEWDSGYLVPKAALGDTGTRYRLDREECHGIKEMLVLLTHLYNEDYAFLIIDEPELNLHPQYQSFFMQEVRRVAGFHDDDQTKKTIFLITHSPFILDFRSVEDVKSVISFDLVHSTPRQIYDLDNARTTLIASLVPRLNVHHKQLFFSDNPIFVEGSFDSQLVQLIQEARGMSVYAAGSCVIDVGGKDEVNKYLQLCQLFGKQAYFLYDLDSLFSGNLRSCIRDDEQVTDFLLALGLGNNFAQYCGELDRRLSDLINEIRALPVVDRDLAPLRDYFDRLSPPGQAMNRQQLAKARFATLVHIARHHDSIADATSPQRVREIEGRLNQIVEALRERKIIILRDGALEHHLPSYNGDIYELSDDAKAAAIGQESSLLAAGMTEEAMAGRYGDLFEAIKLMPGKPAVNFDQTLREYLGRYIYELQTLAVRNPEWDQNRLTTAITTQMQYIGQLFSLENFVRHEQNRFSATVRVRGGLGRPDRYAHVSNETNAGVGNFEIVQRQ